MLFKIGYVDTGDIFTCSMFDYVSPCTVPGVSMITVISNLNHHQTHILTIFSCEKTIFENLSLGNLL